MRYFKYINENKCKGKVLLEHYKSLTKDEKATFRKHKLWNSILLASMLIIFCSVMAVGSLLLKQIPKANNDWLELLRIIGIIIGLFLLLFLSVLLISVLTIPLQKKAASYNLPVVKKEILSCGCQYLRDYYGLGDTYVITKCYDSSEAKFKDHDLCIFISGGELRITTDLVRGFLHGERDLGCYALRREEITLTRKMHAELNAVELKASNTGDEVVFLLGYRASGFIRRNYLNENEKK